MSGNICKLFFVAATCFSCVPGRSEMVSIERVCMQCTHVFSAASDSSRLHAGRSAGKSWECRTSLQPKQPCQLSSQVSLPLCGHRCYQPQEISSKRCSSSSRRSPPEPGLSSVSMVLGQCREKHQDCSKRIQQVGRYEITDRAYAHIQIRPAALMGGTSIELILLYKRGDVSSVPSADLCGI